MVAALTDHKRPELIARKVPKFENKKNGLIASRRKDIPKLPKILSKASRWHLDDTFKSAPTLFYQNYTIHGLYDEEMYNCGYILLKNKKKDIFHRAFDNLKQFAVKENYILFPKLVLLDYEKASILAMQEVFPECEVIGCYFHFIQALWKNIQSKGLTFEYRNDFIV